MVDPRIETIISSQVESQFPGYYRENGPLLVDFLTAYFRWLESDGQNLYHSRRLLAYRDVDTTPDDMLVHYAQKYLNGIQLQTETNTRQLIKHSLDLYRTKGSDRSIELFFRLIYGHDARVYHPSRDVLRLSDGVWRRPEYLELVTTNANLNDFIGYQVVGVSSGARAFVDRVVRKKTQGRIVDLAFLSSVVGEFIPGESVNRQFKPLSVPDCPVVRGSLTGVEVDTSDIGFSPGDELRVQSGRGFGATVRVTSVSDEVGLNQSNLVFGGYGYSANCEALISENILTCQDFQTGLGEYAPLFANLSQTILTGTVNSYSNSQFSVGDKVYSYDGANVEGYGVVGTSSSDSFTLSVRSGTLSNSVVHVQGNTNSANVDSWLDQSAHGRIVGVKRFQAVVGGDGLLVGEEISQTNGFRASVVSCINRQLVFDEVYGEVDTSLPLVGGTSSVSVSVSEVVVQIGVDQVSGAFASGPYFQYSVDGYPSGQVSTVSRTPTSEMSVSVLSLTDTETINVNTDELVGFVDVDLSGTYPFDKYSNSDSNTLIANSLTYIDAEVGRIEQMVLTDPGSGYDTSPVVRFYEPITYPYAGTGFDLTIDSQSSLFVAGEVVSQEDTGARGSVVSSNSSHLVLDRLSFSGSFVPTTNSSTVVVGSTGTSANISTSTPLTYTPTGLGRMGSDSIVSTKIVVGEGSVTGVSVTDSGLGYVKGEQLVMTGPDGTSVTGVAIANGHGVGTGKWINQPDSLSGTKYVFDNDYYQEFSYEVRTQVALPEYEGVVERVVHPAGKRLFAQFESTIVVPERIRISGSYRSVDP